MAGTAFGEILGDSRSTKRCYSPKNCVAEMRRVGSANGWVRDEVGFCSDNPRIMVGSSSNRPSIGQSNSRLFGSILAVTISWQAQYLVMLEGDCCCSAHCTGRFMYDEFISAVLTIKHECRS